MIGSNDRFRSYFIDLNLCCFYIDFVLKVEPQLLKALWKNTLTNCEH